MLLLDCLRSLHPHSSNTTLKRMLSEGRVWIGDRIAKIPKMLVSRGMVVEIRQERFVSGQLAHGTVLFEDEHLIIVDKRESFLSVQTDKEKRKTAFVEVLSYLQKRDRRARLYVVHRLDYGTSGLLLFAKSSRVQKGLKDLFASRIIKRHYRAVVHGHPKETEGKIVQTLSESSSLRVYVSRDPKEGKQAITHYKVLKSGKRHCLLDVKLHTGRRGQIRVGLAHKGHPIVGDTQYGQGGEQERLCLHANLLEFRHPVTQRRVLVESPMPSSFLRIVDKE
jgi:23S rRNA pseudouridine1911/1915/1917 synthase